MLLVISFEELIRLANMKIGGRVIDVEVGQIYYLKVRRDDWSIARPCADTCGSGNLDWGDAYVFP